MKDLLYKLQTMGYKDAATRLVRLILSISIASFVVGATFFLIGVLNVFLEQFPSATFILVVLTVWLVTHAVLSEQRQD